MLFHDPIFIFVFLPLTLSISLILRRFTSQTIIVWFLATASSVFYSYWNLNFVPLLLGSILFNYLVGERLSAAAQNNKGQPLLIFGVAANLLLLINFKYLGMLADVVGVSLGLEVTVPKFELPLGISFFTFLQIAYLVDASQNTTNKTKFSLYLLFVTFFPHLIAGPLVHHRELIPQFTRKISRVWLNLSVGCTIFGIGLFKKLILADQVGTWSDGLFNGAAAGFVPSFIDAWVGAISFSLLIYFDFSAYSDMAIGLSLMLGIKLPENFNSPYKAKSIIDFWRRWHMTLSRFFRDYLYIPLGGNRVGSSRRYFNLVLVMLIAGLWHGASWNFVVWGGLHGGLLLINHAWNKANIFKIYAPVSLGITFLVVVFAWVPFRADTLQTAKTILEGMIGWNGYVLPTHYRELLPNSISAWLISHGVNFGTTTVYGGGMQILILVALLSIVWFLPNTQQIMAKFKPTLMSVAPPGLSILQWKPTLSMALAGSVIGAYLLLLVVQGKSGDFIYFQF